ncbi:MAG: hypothetical protein COX57_01565 [Alphaproteobacteria bacterium CG_4_10_14_0_2_um_filter_63_37]|nr:MAG: hypothetical protein AUJ55_01245 [Proteobacteria bacterium CG1_02_64_396]PJA25840.1 MAG: hypothetical protein COX57_01565 [Alphaproteobacteria bacterium CG_4_10_14_0_2_um_filter_63_37]
MNIAIVGAGNVGRALTQRWAARGLPVVVGVRDPDRHHETIRTLGGRCVTVEQAIAQGDVVVLAVPYAAALDLVQRLPDWGGKVLVDASNPLAPGLTGLTVGTQSSGGEQIARLARGARVVKAFNTTGAENMADPHYVLGRPMMPVCGDDPEARGVVLDLAETLGFEGVDLGTLSSARYLEPLAMVWIHRAIKLGQGREFAFGLLRRA